ncbi:MAG: DUF5320 domain-containing protein [candidate division Zixibacteria bacterium]|nr:DUF5320 domain-containing protein [candidate division Zixibacteria bacterium]
MPRGDRTGPMGAGVMTGRGAGLCAGYDVPGYMNQSAGRGFGRGFGYGGGHGFGRGMGGGFGHGFQGGGRGWRNQYYATGTPGWARGGYGYQYPAAPPAGFGAAVDTKAAQAEELAYLKDQAQYFKGALDDIEKRVNELQKETENSSNTPKSKKE